MFGLKFTKALAACLLCGALHGQGTVQHERLYFATGEYMPSSNWHALNRLDACEGYNSLPGNVQYQPDATIPVRQCTDNGVELNFGHGIYLDAPHDRLYLATIFTNQGNFLTTNSDTAVGSIAIFDSISQKTGAQVPSRHIFGPNTGLKQPHACWLDESRDLLYVANAFGRNILVYENASTADGDIAPSRVISHDSLGGPVFVFIDEAVDRMFVTAMPNGPGTKPQVLVWNNASTANGSPDPFLRIVGQNTRLGLINPTVHNCWWNPSNQLLAVGHHTNELLMFDLSVVNWGSPVPLVLDLAPRVIRVDDPALGFDSTDVNLYGFYWDLATDRMFCSVGIDNHGGGPTPGSPPNAIKVFEQVSDSTSQGIMVPSRTIYWNNGSTYYPPQPIWLQKYNSSMTHSKAFQALQWTCFPNPADDRVDIQVDHPQASQFEFRLLDLQGRLLESGLLGSLGQQGRFVLPTSDLPKGSYLLQVHSSVGTWSKLLMRR